MRIDDIICFSNEAMLCTFWPVHCVIRKWSIDWQHNTAIQCPHAVVTAWLILLTTRLLQSSDDESSSLCISSFYTALCRADMQHALLFLSQPPLPSPTPHGDPSTHTALLDVIIGAFTVPPLRLLSALSCFTSLFCITLLYNKFNFPVIHGKDISHACAFPTTHTDISFLQSILLLSNDTGVNMGRGRCTHQSIYSWIKCIFHHACSGIIACW